MKVACYCALCRAKEFELFGAVQRKANQRHRKAVKLAGCRHKPALSVNARRTASRLDNAAEREKWRRGAEGSLLEPPAVDSRRAAKSTGERQV
jgi:hypothetical protein